MCIYRYCVNDILDGYCLRYAFHVHTVLFIAIFLNLVLANLRSMNNQTITVTLTPMLKNDKKWHCFQAFFYRRSGAATKGFQSSILVSVGLFLFKCNFLCSGIAYLSRTKYSQNFVCIINVYLFGVP